MGCFAFRTDDLGELRERLTKAGIRSEIDIPGKTHSEKWQSIFQLCSEGYFPTLQFRLLRGRLLSETEVNGARKMAVVNQTPKSDDDAAVQKAIRQRRPFGEGEWSEVTARAAGLSVRGRGRPPLRKT